MEPLRLSQHVRYVPTKFCRFLPGLPILLLLLFFTNTSLPAQPLSAYKDGRVITFSEKNQYWFVFQDRQGFIWGYDKDNKVVRFDGNEIRMFPHNPDDPATLQCEGYPVFLEDSEGKIWIAIGGCALERYDPVTDRFEHFGQAVYKAYDGSPRQYHILFEDSRRNIWIGTQAGLFRYGRQQDSIRYMATIWHCYVILEDGQGSIWAGDLTTNRLIRQIDTTDIQAGKRVSVPAVKAFPFSVFQGKAETLPLGMLPGEDRYLMKDAGHIYMLDRRQDTVYTTMSGLLEDEWVSFVFQEDGVILAGTSKGRIMQFDPVSNHLSPFLNLPVQYGEDPVARIFKSNEGILWVVSQSKTYQVLPAYSPFRKKVFPEDIRPLTAPGHHDLLVSYKGNIHYHVKDGLRPVLENRPGARSLKLDFTDRDFDVPPEEYKRFSRARDPAALSGFKYAEDPVNKKLWLLLYQYPIGMKLISYDEQGKKTFKHYCNGRDTCFVDHFIDFKIDSKGRLMMAGWAGFSLYDPVKHTFLNFKRKEKFNDFATLSVLEDSKQQIWIGNNNRGVIRFNPQTGQFAHFTHKPDDHTTISTNYKIYDIIEDKYGHLWFATLSGLNRLDPWKGTFQRFFEKDGLPSNVILSVIEDKNKHIWIVTRYSLTRYDPEKKAFYIFEGRDGLPVETFSEKGSAEGPSVNNFRENGAFADSKDYLFFETSDGVVYFHPDSVLVDEKMPKLVFTGFLLFNEPVKVGDKNNILLQSITHTNRVTLKYGQDVFTIRYAALEFLFPDKIQYSFQLEGYDKEWRMVNNTKEATYTNLDPGDYQFKVRCRNHHGFWSEPITLQITIRPPWYRSTWAYLLYILTAGGLLSGIRFYELKKKLAQAEERRIKELNEVKSRLYTNITHEFRTPLTIINGIAGKWQRNADYQLREDLETVKRYGRRLLTLINQMLDLAKLESGALPLHMVQGDVVVFIKYLLESFHSLANAKNISLGFESAVESFVMDHDPVRLQEILTNLLSNAIKFTPDGGKIMLRLDTVKMNKPKSGKSSGMYFQISVSDTGRGIPSDQMERIFERFYQVDDTSTRQGEGTGIGLTLTQELVKLLGGNVAVSSEVGKGAEFTVRLPVTRRAQPATTNLPDWKPSEAAVPVAGAIMEQSSATLPAKEAPRLLLIEDNPDLLQYLASILQNEYRLLTAGNGRAGLEIAQKEIPDIIISDVMMPEMDGYEVCRRLKEDLATCHIPIILLTARADAASKIQGLEQGADVYLAKPFDEKELKVHLKKLIEVRERLRRYYGSSDFLHSGSARYPAPVPTHDDQLLIEITQAIESNLADAELSAENLAKQLHLTYNTCFRKVKALTGMGVKEYIQHVRLHRAAFWLLESPDRPVKDIALDAGFNSAQFFSRQFKKAMGKTPLEYRKARD